MCSVTSLYQHCVQVVDLKNEKKKFNFVCQ